MKEATELEYLRWLAGAIDFGPAHEDCMMALQEGFENETKKKVPKPYRYR